MRWKMAEYYQIKYQCGECRTLHEAEGKAADCCLPEVFKVYICEVCEDDYDYRSEAEKCCAKELEGVNND
jgi:hypothetical protein